LALHNKICVLKREEECAIREKFLSTCASWEKKNLQVDVLHLINVLNSRDLFVAINLYIYIYI